MKHMPDIAIIQESTEKKAALVDRILGIIGGMEQDNPNSGEKKKDSMSKQKKEKSGLSWIERTVLGIVTKRITKILSKMKSPKTTWVGVAALLTALGAGLKAVFDGDPSTNIDLNEIGLALLGLIGLFAKDDDKNNNGIPDDQE